jgi:hypothetical protein
LQEKAEESKKFELAAQADARDKLNNTQQERKKACQKQKSIQSQRGSFDNLKLCRKRYVLVTHNHW